MNNIFKFIILTAIVLLVISGVIFSVLNVLDIYTSQVSMDYFIKSSWIIGLFALGSLIISFVINSFKK